MGQHSLLSLMAPQRIAATRIAVALNQDNTIRHPRSLYNRTGDLVNDVGYA